MGDYEISQRKLYPFKEKVVQIESVQIDVSLDDKDILSNLKLYRPQIVSIIENFILDKNKHINII